jgi:hypothetical protein
MAGFRSWGLALLTLGLLVQQGRSGDPEAFSTPPNPYGSQTAAEEHVCVIYSLAEFGDDASLGKWIAETIPEVIAPGTWNQEGKKQVLRYFAPKRILVVSHTSAVQAKVESFLKDMKKKGLAAEKERTVAAVKATANQGVVHARHTTPAPMNLAEPSPEQKCNYPVPAQPQQPKHLFHFIIRYEGAGIIDSNVIKYMKLQNGDKEEKKAETAPTAPTAQAPSFPSAGTTGLTPSSESLPSASARPMASVDKDEKEEK